MLQTTNIITKYSTILLVLLISLLSSACQYTEDSTAETGELSILLTDAKGDFSNYTVDVISLSLTKANGTQIEVLPEETRIDFSQYVEMTELLTAASISSGVYTKASMILDYSNNDIWVENAAGDNVKVDDIKDEDGNTLSKLDVTINLLDRSQLRIRRGVPALLSLDFDLKTSNIVEFDSQDIPHIIVSPVLTASLEPDLDKSHRIRGPLDSVNLTDNTFTLFIKPFFKSINNKDRHFGIFKVYGSDTTVYDINGVTYEGFEGLTALSEVEKYTGTITLGNIDLATKSFTATQVYAGSSVPGGNMDGLQGTVLSRNGDELIVQGATLIRTDGSVLFNNEVKVSIADTTVIKRQGDENGYHKNDISIGQKVTVLGVFNEDTVNPAIDATEGYAKLNLTELTGTVVTENQITDQNLAVDLIKINKRKTELFDFSGTGDIPENDADPEFYEIDTAELNISNLTNNQLIKVRGFVNSFGQAPADFIANTIIDPGTLRASMHTNWSPATSNAFSLIANDKLTLDFTETGRFHHIGRRHHRFDLTALNTDFSLVPHSSNSAGIYVIHFAGSKNLHTSFAAFTADLQAQVDADNTVKRIKAIGNFDSNTGDMSTNRVSVHFE